MRKKLIIHSLFGASVVLLNILYFYLFFSLLNLSFTGLSILFIIAGSLSYFVILNVFHARLWHFFCYLVYFALVLWSLVNYAYFGVFKTFINFNFQRLGSGSWGLFKDFYSLVPVEMYIGAFIFISGLIINSVFYFQLLKKPTLVLLFNSTYADLSKSNKRKIYHIFIWILLFLFINSTAFMGCIYLANFPRATWWNVENQTADLGFWGYLYNQALAQRQSADRIEPLDASTGMEVIKSEPVEASFRTKTEEVYQAISSLVPSKLLKNNIPLPRFEGQPNVIVIQLESIGNWAINNQPSPMPFLKSLIENNVSIPRFHANSCQTINAEFAALCSFWPDSYDTINASHQNKNYDCLPSVLKRNFGYQSYFFHSDVPEFWNRKVLLPLWGFENLHLTPYYKLKADDKTVFLDALKTLSSATKPFLGYLVSFTSHSPHNDDMIAYHKTANNLEIQPFTGTIGSEINNVELSESDLRKYFGFLTATDEALSSFFTEFQKTELAQNTIVVIYNDHRYFNFDGDDVSDFTNRNEMPFVLVLPDGTKGELANMASHVDIAPTILNLIEGDRYELNQNFIGTSLFSDAYVEQVVNKCLSNIYYANNELIISGSAKTGLYRITDTKKPLSEVESAQWLNLVDALIRDSDEALFQNQLVK